jgi:hypothetical protein
MKLSPVLFLLGFISVANADPLTLHPKNPHYFLLRGKPAVLIGSTEHYGALLNLDFDYVKYLEATAAAGLNLTRTFTGAYVEPQGAFKIAQNTLAPAAGRLICPWARSDQAGYVHGGNKFDLTKWDPAYFARLKNFMTVAEKRGVIVEMNLFTPMYEQPQWDYSPMNARNNVNGIGKVGKHEVYTLDKEPALLALQIEMTRKLVTELNSFDNLFFEVMNEPYFGGVTQPWHDRIAETIAETEKALPKKHLISWNVANGAKKVTQPHAAISILNFHYSHPPDAVAQNYRLNLPIGENETGFKGTEDDHYRMEAWEFMLAGGALFNHLDYSFCVGHEDGSFAVKHPTPGGGGAKLRQSFAFLRTFLERFDLPKMRPAPELIRKGAPERWRALGDGGTRFAVYAKGAAPAEIEFALPNGRWQERWFDSTNGMLLLERTVEAEDGRAVLKLPECCSEVALDLTLAPRD